MSLHETERRQLRRQHADDSNLVYTFKEWCAINNISARTGARILAGPNPPIVTRLSEKKIGITRANNAQWVQSRSSSR